MEFRIQLDDQALQVLARAVAEVLLADPRFLKAVRAQLQAAVVEEEMPAGPLIELPDFDLRAENGLGRLREWYKSSLGISSRAAGYLARAGILPRELTQMDEATLHERTRRGKTQWGIGPKMIVEIRRAFERVGLKPKL